MSLNGSKEEKISFFNDEGTTRFNFRVGAIITDTQKKKILLHRMDNYNFWLLPGGRLDMMESTEDAIIREIKEELGVQTKSEGAIAMTESFYEMKGKNMHEIALNYLLKVPENSLLLGRNEEFAGLEGEEYRFKWFDREQIKDLNIRPDYLKPVLSELPEKFTHIIKDERIKENIKDDDGEER